MVDRTSICELEISMSFVDLLEVCLQEATSYAASEHDGTVLLGSSGLESMSASIQGIRGTVVEMDY